MTVPDPGSGVHNERTALAWQRTALSLLGGSAIVTRLSLDSLGLAAVLGFVVALVLVGLVLRESRGRYHDHAGIRRRPRPRGGGAPAMLAVVTAIIGLTALASLLTRR